MIERFLTLPLFTVFVYHFTAFCSKGSSKFTAMISKISQNISWALKGKEMRVNCDNGNHFIKCLIFVLHNLCFFAKMDILPFSVTPFVDKGRFRETGSIWGVIFLCCY